MLVVKWWNDGRAVRVQDEKMAMFCDVLLFALSLSRPGMWKVSDRYHVHNSLGTALALEQA